MEGVFCKECDRLIGITDKIFRGTKETIENMYCPDCYAVGIAIKGKRLGRTMGGLSPGAKTKRDLVGAITVMDTFDTMQLSAMFKELYGTLSGYMKRLENVAAIQRTGKKITRTAKELRSNRDLILHSYSADPKTLSHLEDKTTAEYEKGHGWEEFLKRWNREFSELEEAGKLRDWDEEPVLGRTDEDG